MINLLHRLGIGFKSRKAHLEMAILIKTILALVVLAVTVMVIFTPQIEKAINSFSEDRLEKMESGDYKIQDDYKIGEKDKIVLYMQDVASSFSKTLKTCSGKLGSSNDEYIVVKFDKTVFKDIPIKGKSLEASNFKFFVDGGKVKLQLISPTYTASYDLGIDKMFTVMDNKDVFDGKQFADVKSYFSDSTNVDSLNTNTKLGRGNFWEVSSGLWDSFLNNFRSGRVELIISKLDSLLVLDKGDLADKLFLGKNKYSEFSYALLKKRPDGKIILLFFNGDGYLPRQLFSGTAPCTGKSSVSGSGSGTTGGSSVPSSTLDEAINNLAKKLNTKYPKDFCVMDVSKEIEAVELNFGESKSLIVEGIADKQELDLTKSFMDSKSYGLNSLKKSFLIFRIETFGSTREFHDFLDLLKDLDIKKEVPIYVDFKSGTSDFQISYSNRISIREASKFKMFDGGAYYGSIDSIGDVTYSADKSFVIKKGDRLLFLGVRRPIDGSKIPDSYKCEVS